MSFAVVRPFFRARLEGLGYEEHVDAVDFQNIESSVLDNAFQLFTDNISGTSANQLAHDFDYSMTVRIFRRGFNDNVQAYDEADADIDTVLADILDPAVRLGVAIKDIVPSSIRKIQLSSSDDNDIVIEFNFGVRIISCFA